MSRTPKILNIIGIILVVFQLLAYLGRAKGEKEAFTDTIEQVAYYIGFSFFLIIAIILFIIAYSIRRKEKKRAQDELIDSIGRNE